MKYTLKATIPTGSYANIQPEITVEAESFAEARDAVMPHIREMFLRYSDTPLKEKGQSVLLKSFNEDVEIEFDPIAHEYLYKGKSLLSASTFTKQHEKEFDKLGISKTCEKAWGIPQADILDLWKSNGESAAGFGTALHAVLEHYFRYKKLGQTILEKSKKEENAALPNHPFLKKLILDLEKIMGGESEQEILVSNVEKGFCGLVDNLLIVDRIKKVCRVRDYKITHEVEKKGEKLLEPFNELSPTKLSKYQIQLSFYANLLEMSGWTVEGLDVYNFDNEWFHYPLEVIQVIK